MDKNNLIVDYEIEVKLALWSSKFDKLHPDFEGNPFYECSLLNFGHKRVDADPAIIHENWNEFEHQTEHPLNKEFHCYTFHHIYDHTDLSWEDIVSIEDVWIEIVVNNQFLIDIANG